jgi:hypothetical protein
MGRTTSLTLSADEVASKRLSPASLAAGVASLREHGFVLIENAVPLPLLRRDWHRTTLGTQTYPARALSLCTAIAPIASIR